MFTKAEKAKIIIWTGFTRHKHKNQKLVNTKQPFHFRDPDQCLLRNGNLIRSHFIENVYRALDFIILRWLEIKGTAKVVNTMDKKSVTQETASVKMSFLQLPGAEREFGNSRVPSATSSVKSGSIHFATTVRMLAPVIWSRIQSKQKVWLCHCFIKCCCVVILGRFDAERLARPYVLS